MKGIQHRVSANTDDNCMKSKLHGEPVISFIVLCSQSYGMR